MTRYVPDPRSKSEEEALFTCLFSILDTLKEVSGYIHVWQPLENGTFVGIADQLPDFQSAFWDAEWEFENSIPVELYYRQQSYGVEWIKAGIGSYPNVESIISIAVDLDPYSLEPPMPVHDAVTAAMDRLKEFGLPLPNYVDFSGNGHAGGAYLKWNLIPLHSVAGLERYRDRHYWTQTAKALVGFLRPFGADPAVTDLARWLRVPGSLNAKYLDQGNGSPSFREYHHDHQIDLSELAQPLAVKRLKGQPSSTRYKHAAKTVVHNNEPVEELSALQSKHPAMHVADKLWRLNQLRGGIKKGRRNDALYIYTCLFAGSPLAPEIIEEKALILASSFTPALPEQEVSKTIRQGLNSKPYKISYSWLIDRFSITTSEQMALGIEARPPMHNEFGTVIPAYRNWHLRDARERTMQSRRRQGVRPIREVNAEKSRCRANAKRDAVRRVLPLNQTQVRLTTTEIAQKAGVSWNTAKKYRYE